MTTIMQHDPHHLYPSSEQLYWFFILAPLLVAAVMYAGFKLFTYLEQRKDKREKKD